jgi:hypothetical protein
MRRSALRIVFGFSAALALPLACVLGEEREPGCQRDDECGDGFVCRDGACFRFTTGLSPPHDPSLDDAGSDGARDAALD